MKGKIFILSSNIRRDAQQKSQKKIFNKCCFLAPSAEISADTKKKIRKFSRIFSLFDPYIIYHDYVVKKLAFFSQRPIMSNQPPENIWGFAKIFSHFFAIFGQTFFYDFYYLSWRKLLKSIKFFPSYKISYLIPRFVVPES